MKSLEDLLGSELGQQAVNQISANVGADNATVGSAVQMALPALINGLAANANSPEGAESLNNALDEHDGSVLDNLGGLAGSIFGGGAPESPQTNAGGILGHILGDKQNEVAQDVSGKTGLGTGQVMQILMYLAPIVMGYLGRQKMQSSGGDGIGGILGGLLGGGQPQAGSSGNSIVDMATGMLDSDQDGSAVDDIASAALNYFRNK